MHICWTPLYPHVCPTAAQGQTLCTSLSLGAPAHPVHPTSQQDKSAHERLMAVPGSSGPCYSRYCPLSWEDKSRDKGAREQHAMSQPRLLEALQGHLALTAAPASPSLPLHTLPPSSGKKAGSFQLWGGATAIWACGWEGHQIQQMEESGDKSKHAKEKHVASPPPYLLSQIFRNRHLCPVSLNKEGLPYWQLSLSHAAEAFLFCYGPCSCPAPPRATGTGMQLRPARTTERRNPAMQPLFPSPFITVKLQQLNICIPNFKQPSLQLPANYSNSPPIFTGC